MGGETIGKVASPEGVSFPLGWMIYYNILKYGYFVNTEQIKNS